MIAFMIIGVFFGTITGAMIGLKDVLLVVLSSFMLYIFVVVSVNFSEPLIDLSQAALNGLHLFDDRQLLAPILTYLLLILIFALVSFFSWRRLGTHLSKLAARSNTVGGGFVGAMLGYGVSNVFGIIGCVFLFSTALLSLLKYIIRRVPARSWDNHRIDRLEENSINSLESSEGDRIDEDELGRSSRTDTGFVEEFHQPQIEFLPSNPTDDSTVHGRDGDGP